MDQGKLFWPNFWLKEPWINFDVGILPENIGLKCGKIHHGLKDHG